METINKIQSIGFALVRKGSEKIAERESGENLVFYHARLHSNLVGLAYLIAGIAICNYSGVSREQMMNSSVK